MRRIIVLVVCLVLVVLAWPGAVAAQPTSKPAELAGKWGDQGDGTFVNPILPADFSDLDAIRVGDDFYAISSTLHLSPGMAVLHSKDMVNWQIISHAVSDVTQIGPEMNWDRMNRYGKGVWAGAIRHHDGKFWIYFGAPDEGIFVTTATNPAGPWEPLHAVWKVSGWNDTCPFWDDDGQGYLVTTNFARDPANGQTYNIHLFKMTPDGKGLVMESDQIIYQSRGSEASKLYKTKGMYYHYFSEVHSEGRVVMMRRARSLAGPWETRQLNHVNSAIDKSPNQGGLIELASGEWWFVTHQGTGDWDGRTMALLPVQWIDGWPILGKPGDDGIGNMVWSAKKPVMGMPVEPFRTNDEFDATTLAQHWEWNHQPRGDKWSLTQRPGFMRLHAFKPLRPNDLLRAGNTLSQRVLRTRENLATVSLDLTGMSDGQQAGMCHFSRTFATLGVLQSGKDRKLIYNEGGRITEGPAIPGDHIWLSSTWGLDGTSHYAYSTDGKTFTPFGPAYRLGWGHYRGDRVGVYSYNNIGESGYVDVDWFHYAFAGAKPQ